jgi:hypothetical protein
MAAAARERFARKGLEERADGVVGNFFEPISSGADAYVLTAIIHDWDDIHAERILRRCADAAGERGRVLVIEKIGVDGRTPNTRMDLLLLTQLGGKERTRDEVSDLAERAGLRTVRVHEAGAIVIFEFATRL